MLCGALGLGVLLAMWQWSQTLRRRWLITAGVAIGLGMLSHPFAMVYAVQAGVWVLAAPGRWTQRIGRASLLTAVAVATFAAWGVLIVQHPEAFRSQFFNNVVNQSGPGLFSRLVWPVKSFVVQTPLFIEYAGPVQAAVMTAGLAAVIWLALRSRDAGCRLAAVLSASAVYLHVAMIGVHPTKGYWCFTGALLFACVGGIVARALHRLNRQQNHLSVDPSPGYPLGASPPNDAGHAIGTARGGEGGKKRAGWTTVAAVGIAAAIMLPGAGLRTVIAHVRHWNDINYDAPRFTQELMAAVPADAKLVVDPGYIFDFYRAGRDVTLGLDYVFFFSVRGTKYDYVVAGPYSLRDKVPQTLNADYVRSYGDRNDLFACYSEIYRSPTPKEEEPRK
jgi:hypothetical protein